MLFEYIEEVKKPMRAELNRTRLMQAPKHVPEMKKPREKYFKMHVSPHARIDVIMACEGHVLKRFARFFIHQDNYALSMMQINDLVPGEKTVLPGRGPVVMRLK